MLDALKEILTKEVDLKEFLEMEIELNKIKELLATEIKIKEFLVQEIDIKKMFSSHEQAMLTQQSIANDDEDTDIESVSNETIEKGSPESGIKKEVVPIMLPPYDYGLIDTLRADHKEIIFLQGEIVKYAQDEKYELVARRLEAFSTKVKAHFHQADKELYSYLKTFILQRYPKREKAFTELSLEMKNISIEVFFCLTQSPNIPMNKTNRVLFINEFRRIGELLQNRIHREETVLYVMYEESNEALDIS